MIDENTTTVEAPVMKTPFGWWLHDLRSGNYRQGKGVLRAFNNRTGLDEFCCLGVGCDRAVKNNVIPEPERDDAIAASYVYAGHEDAILPPAVRDWLGLPDSDPKVTVGDYATWISLHNDERGATFEQLADALEAAFPHLLTPTATNPAIPG